MPCTVEQHIEESPRAYVERFARQNGVKEILVGISTPGHRAFFSSDPSRRPLRHSEPHFSLSCLNKPLLAVVALNQRVSRSFSTRPPNRSLSPGDFGQQQGARYPRGAPSSANERSFRGKPSIRARSDLVARAPFFSTQRFHPTVRPR